MNAIGGSPAAETARPPFWASAWFWAVLALLETAPFWFGAIPPLGDLPGHAGRYHIMVHLAGSPYLSRYYGFRWALIGNLGADILMTVLGPLLGAERGAWLIAAATPALMTLAIFALSRTIHGRLQPSSFPSLPFIYARGLKLGFLNYDLSVATALLLFSLWVALQARPRFRAALFLAAAFALWICHALGWGLLCLMIGGFELQAAIVAQGWRPAAALQTAARVWPLAPPILLIAGVATRAPTPAIVAASAPTTVSGWLIHKLLILLALFSDQAVLLEASLVMAAVLGLILLVRRGAITMSPALAIPAALVAAATIAMPPVAAGIAEADIRLAPVAALLLVLSLRLASTRWAGVVVASALMMTAFGLGVVAVGWSRASADYERHLAALRYVPMGARILVLVPFGPDGSLAWPPMSHLGDLAIVRRDALVNSEWEIAGAQLLRVRANRDIAYDVDPSQFVQAAQTSQALANAPLDHFDFAWVLGPYPPGPASPHLQLVYADDATRLFRVNK